MTQKDQDNTLKNKQTDDTKQAGLLFSKDLVSGVTILLAVIVLHLLLGVAWFAHTMWMALGMLGAFILRAGREDLCSRSSQLNSFMEKILGSFGESQAKTINGWLMQHNSKKESAKKPTVKTESTPSKPAAKHTKKPSARRKPANKK